MLEPFKNKWALPGGFVFIDETTEACAKRILLERAKVWRGATWQDVACVLGLEEEEKKEEKFRACRTDANGVATN